MTEDYSLLPAPDGKTDYLTKLHHICNKAFPFINDYPIFVCSWQHNMKTSHLSIRKFFKQRTAG
ncbi:MAG: hypothetical protein GX587_12440 [Bacteroidales bacterium]|nr:hypothetical protein [Bacteroidales bacterium]